LRQIRGVFFRQNAYCPTASRPSAASSAYYYESNDGT
jgi:hypothetical protein